MQIHPDVPKNPYEKIKAQTFELQKAANIPGPAFYGKMSVISISDQEEKLIDDTAMTVQNMCLPTIRSFSNTLNITELQERVFLDWRPYIDRLNICLMRSRTINHSHQCAQQYLSEFNNVFLQHLKEILKEY